MNSVDMEKFLSQFKEHQQISLEASAKTINATIFEMYKKIVDRTPVGDPSLWNYPAPADYVPGTLKASWKISLRNTQRNQLGQFASSDQILSGHGLSFKLGTPQQQTAVIYNPQPYAQRVETGWSTQAPRGMMRVTIAEYAMLLDKQAKKFRIT